MITNDDKYDFVASLRSFGKERDGIPDHDVRPVTVMDSIIRAIDACCEIGTVAVDMALKILRDVNGEAALQVDAVNAFNNVSRQGIYDLLVDGVEDLINWYTFLYDGAITIDYSACFVEQRMPWIWRLNVVCWLLQMVWH
eukprot:122656_1